MGAPLVPSQVPRLTSKSKWDGNASLLSNLLPDFILCTVLHPSENVSCPIALHIYQNNLVCSSFKDAHTIAGVWCAYFLHIHKPYKNIHKPHKNIFTSRSHIQGGGTVHCSRDEPSTQADFKLTRSFGQKRGSKTFNVYLSLSDILKVSCHFSSTQKSQKPVALWLHSDCTSGWCE